MGNIGDGRKVCSFCGENIASDFKRCPYCGSLLETDATYSYDDPQDTFNTEKENIATDHSAYRFDKTINDSTSVADFTGQAVSGQQYVKYSEDDFALKEALENSETLDKGPEPAKKTDNAGGNAGVPKPEIRHADTATPKPINEIVNNMYANTQKKSLGNGMKVFMVMLSNLLPGIGQLFGVIAAIVFMSVEGDKDRKSFGKALLISSVIAFVITVLAFAFLTLCFA
ncbi:MAG TPA: zinc ribbon domain-containing protein [Acetivibrio sp.]|uniref:zinc ribbon domain-containing protein n=1 Tax=Acetivibrio sp. TaxID=1872092 RepID=UPI002C4BF3E4|nr:zinc ribbon domain-containing protein [Acetivibrio sp.]HOM02382.1 zinc ribbon domain-containing protein [Acetivibrio sp.]